jgi:hypothetical protein
MRNPVFRYRRGVAVMLFAAAIFGWAASPSLAQQLMSESAARKAIELAYGVQVIGIEAGGKDGWRYFTVRVMNPAGDFNEAFMVSVLVVDRQTGKIVPQYRQGDSGAELSGPERRGVRGDTGPVLRRESMR